MEQNTRQNIIIILMVVNIVGMVILFSKVNNKVAYIERQFNNFNNSINDNINNTGRTLQSKLDEMFEKQFNKVDAISYNLNKVYTDTQTADIIIDVALLEKQGKSTVYVVCEDGESGKKITSELTQVDGLDYQAHVVLALDGNYWMTVVEETALEDLAQLSYTPLNINLETIYYDDRVTGERGGGSGNDKGLLRECYFQTNRFGIEAFEVATIEIEISYRDEAIDRYDITDNLLKAQSSEALTVLIDEEPVNDGLEGTSRTASASGWGTQKVVTNAPSNVASINYEPTYYMHRWNIIYDQDYTELELDEMKINDLGITYIITFKDGYIKKIRI